MSVVVIDVTQDDIDAAWQEAPASITTNEYVSLCPVARAAARALGKPVSVGSDLTVYTPEISYSVVVPLPDIARDAITAFDIDVTSMQTRRSSETRVKPFTFEVTVPE
jgi:hypothetical protein